MTVAVGEVEKTRHEKYLWDHQIMAVLGKYIKEK